MKTLISFDEGLALVLANVPRPLSEVLPIINSYGRTLMTSVFSPSTSPPFDQSAMDGYAFSFKDLTSGKPLRVVDMVKAGEESKPRLKQGQCVRIFTGAPLPAGADTVVMQEKCEVKDLMLRILDPALKKGANVRVKGSLVKRQQIISLSGDKMTAARMAFFSSLSIAKVKVKKIPVVSIIVTGDELINPGERRTGGQVYECNSAALTGALKSVMHQPDIRIFRAGDNLPKTTSTLRKAMKDSDLILLTGGVSVGDFDFVIPALKALKASIVFHKIRQKPGKPVCLAKLNNKMIFGLPGNPASVLTCFYSLVVPALTKWADTKSIDVTNIPLGHTLKRKPGLTQFLKAEILQDAVHILEGQESNNLESFAKANALVKIPEAVSELKARSIVEVIILPQE